MDRDFLRYLISEIKKGDWKTLVVELQDSPFELEEELKKDFGDGVLHFWSPGSTIGLLIVEGKCQIFWALGRENRILRKDRGKGSSEAIEGISSASISDPFMVAFKERY